MFYRISKFSWQFVSVASDCAEFTILKHFQKTILLASSMHANIFLLSLGVHWNQYFELQVEPKLT